MELQSLQIFGRKSHVIYLWQKNNSIFWIVKRTIIVAVAILVGKKWHLIVILISISND